MDPEQARALLQSPLKRATFERAAVQISIPPLPRRLMNEPVRRFVFCEKLWRVERIDGEQVLCREATVQEMADIMEANREQSS